MKTFSDDVLAALQRGDAIVSASVEIIPVGAATPTVIAAVDDVWKYQEEAPDSTADYSAADYDDSAWATGNGGFGNYAPGAGTAAPNTIIFGGIRPTTTGNIVWLRKHLGPLTVRPISLTTYADDVSEAWFNGTSITLTDDGSFTLPGEIASGLIEPSGDNIIAIKVSDVSGDVIYAAASLSQTITGTAPDPIRLWGGYGDADLPSDAGTSTFNGIGDRGLVASSTGAIGGTAQNLTLALSGIEPAALEVLNPDEVRDASVVVRRLIFDSAGKTLLGAYVFCRGRLDELKTSEMVGGAAAIQVSVEGAARGLGRRGGRARSDADQRLVSSTDGFYRVVSAAPKKTLYWGGKTPSIGGSLTGGGGGTTSASTSISSVRSF